MSLAAGARLGPYEIVGSLGAGGMGEVYRARDTRLDRDVALKILPEHFANDPERLARFEREAKTLASLNHPNIAHVHTFDVSREVSPAITFLAMELVEGETLADRIARAPVAMSETIAIARQITEGLEAAHERGIVHRDLKPANIKIAPDGTVKVLDFGLAKAIEGSGGSGGSGRSGENDHLNSPTITTPAMTAAGIILGTAAYMAPEQARGKAVDKRADIWAFGCVVYEMLTGRLAFGGASMTDTLSAITRDEPDLSALPADTPGAVKHLLARCFQKDASQRLRDIGEARIILTNPQATPVAIATASQRADMGRRWPALVGAAALAIMAGVIGFTVGTRRESASGSIRTHFTQLTDQPGFERQPTISPDGRSVVYVSDARGNSDLYLLRVGGRNAVLLTGDSHVDDYAPAFSPDGNRVAFRSERSGGGIYVMEATGESVRRVTDRGYDPQWAPDGSALVIADEAVVDPMSRALSQSTLSVVNIADGTRRTVAKGDAVSGHWSPNGHWIAYWGRDQQSSNRDLYVVASDGTQADTPIKLTNDAAVDWSPAWSPDGRFLYFASNRGGTMNLWRIAMDASSGRPTSEPQGVTTPTAWSGWFELTADGRSVVFGDMDDRTTIWATAFDPVRGEVGGRPRVVLQGFAINSIALSPDGQKIAFSQRGQPCEALGTIHIDGSGWSRLTDDDVYHRVPAWSPSGDRIAFYRSNGLLTIREDGGGLTEIVLPTELRPGFYPSWSPDGRRLAISSDRFSGIVDVSTSPAQTVALEPFEERVVGFLPHSWSPDGRWIAGTNRFNVIRDQVVVRDANLKGPRIVASPGKSPVWLPDGRRLLYSSPTGLVLLDVESGQERAVVSLPRSEFLWGRLISLSRDGRTLIYLGSQSEGDVWLMRMEEE